ncbi:MAG TPA: acetyl-CoA carboxylase biotin carboxylase subunit [Spirochaetota bacterium]|nr:acetyl-CoA carboxylase biotin carboxylase subunit [Spirochaetota bacterium]
MFKKILIANRGEIGVRVINTCREMGITSVAVYSDADRHALHVLKADQAVRLGGPPAAESYLNIDRIIDAAKQTGAEAVHPGYGFLSENAEFAARCLREGLVFIGPSADTIRNLGDKITARKIMIENNVPVVPGTFAAETDPEVLGKEADRIGYPVLIKATAGGGGKGMRIVSAPGDFRDACVSASREAAAAFGNGNVYLEKFLARPRHIEFQILADTHGNIIHLHERECSVQRRHQKIIEETPSIALGDDLRKRMAAAAVAVAAASGYVNAGTVEFLLDRDGGFYFLEVNTRLQVEHAVTEMVTGIDIVRQQIEIACGNPLPFRQEDIRPRGHAIECRIYAEDAEKDFSPSPGTIRFLKEPSGPGIRHDCGIYAGFTVPMEYDPILAKLITHSENRKECISRMIEALRDYALLGIKHSIPFLIDVLRSDAFADGDLCTDFIELNFSEWKPTRERINEAFIAFLADDISGERETAASTFSDDSRSSPWRTLGSWRL